MREKTPEKYKIYEKTPTKYKIEEKTRFTDFTVLRQISTCLPHYPNWWWSEFITL